MEARLTGEDIYQLTRLAVLEYLSGGITSIFEMYLDPGMAARACVDMGNPVILYPDLALENRTVLPPVSGILLSCVTVLCPGHVLHGQNSCIGGGDISGL